MSARGAAAAALLAVLVAAPAAAQRQGAVARLVSRLMGQAEAAAADTTPPQRFPRALKPCGTLYVDDVRRIAEGPELASSYAAWISASEAVIADNGGLPLPVCFEFRQNEMVTNLGRYLVAVNRSFMSKRFSAPPPSEAALRFHAGYLLTGYTDPLENDTTLARERAEWVQAHSPLPACRYRVRTVPGRPTEVYFRKVYYRYEPVVATCPRPPS
ncbi:MAG TPA: hypothetical protein VEW03_03010 [Longimicrobiaceae bacterium]|nr:hypothetical protein [Longimicrobiaceae bacterium]